MKHLSAIQIEFLKSAVWDDRPYKFQKRYIRQHPKSKYRVTAPLSEEKCKNCGGRLKIKDHGKWEGYYCPQCGTGGSRQKKRPGKLNWKTPRPTVLSQTFSPTNVQEQEERLYEPSTHGELDAADAAERGFNQPDSQWVLSDRDVWHKNPHYHGPDQPHPEELQRLQELQSKLDIESVIDIKPEFYNKANKTFTFEISEVENVRPTQIVFLKNPSTGVKMRFTQYKIDKDSTDEDTYGWRYKSDDKKYELLIIND